MNAPDKIVALVGQNEAMQVLAQIHNGLTLTELAEAQRLAVEAVKRTGKKAEIKLVIVIEPDGKGEVTSVETKAKVDGKLPRKNLRPTTFFGTAENGLQRTDPNQPELNFPTPAAAKAAAN